MIIYILASLYFAPLPSPTCKFAGLCLAPLYFWPAQPRFKPSSFPSHPMRLKKSTPEAGLTPSSCHSLKGVQCCHPLHLSSLILCSPSSERTALHTSCFLLSPLTPPPCHHAAPVTPLPLPFKTEASAETTPPLHKHTNTGITPVFPPAYEVTPLVP